MEQTQQPCPVLSPSEQECVDRWNRRTKGGVKTPNCPICGDKLIVYITPTSACFCECKKRHDSERMLKNSGLSEKMKSYTFVSFEAKEKWQDDMKKKAYAFCGASGDWLFFGGQVGSGKTHICTAAVNAMIQKGRMARYMVWPDEVDGIKGNADGFSQKLEKLMNIPVLYIDDFLKSPNGKTRSGQPAAPTDGELAAAFKIVNYRYRKDKITLFSSEFFVDEIMKFDSGIASRIHEKSKNYQMRIGREENRNQRLTR